MGTYNNVLYVSKIFYRGERSGDVGLGYDVFEWHWG